MTINERLKYLRKEILNMTQQEFSDAIGLGRTTIGNIEIGKINLTDRNVSAICDEFNVSEDWILTGGGEIFRSLDIDRQIARGTAQLMDGKESFEKSMIAMMLQMDSEDWVHIKKFIKKLAVIVDDMD